MMLPLENPIRVPTGQSFDGRISQVLMTEAWGRGYFPAPFLLTKSMYRKRENQMGDLKILEGARYAKTDEWVKVEGGEGIVGISDYAQDALSDLVYAELPEVGESYTMGQEFGTVESVKASAALLMPLSGEIVAVNDDLNASPELMNTDPYGKGWIVKIKVADPSELDALMDAAAYEAYCKNR